MTHTPTIHGSPERMESCGGEVTTCCGRSLFELPRSDRLTLNRRRITCPDQAQLDALVEQFDGITPGDSRVPGGNRRFRRSVLSFTPPAIRTRGRA